MVGMHMVSDPVLAVRSAIARWQEMLAAARDSGDPDDFEAAWDAWLDAADLAGEYDQLDELEGLL